jgi:hypothetical protein
MNNISAAIGLGNLANIDKILARRRRLADIYSSYGLFAHSWLAGALTGNYGLLKDIYANNGIEIGQHHYRNDKYTIFKPFKSSCPIMDELEGHYFFVPFHYGVSEKQAHKIGQIWQES